MARPPLPVGTWGSISVQPCPGGYRARTRFRDFDGVTRPVERVGRTKGAARAALTSALVERAAPMGEYVTADSRLSEVIAVWFAERDDLATNTRRRYRQVIEGHILPGVGNLRVREASVTALDRHIKTLAKNSGTTTAKQAASILSGVMGLAVRHGAARANPMRDVAPVTITTKEPRALTLDEVKAIRTAVRRWQQGLPVAPTDDPRPKRGRPPTQDLLDVVDVFLATGVRIGELLALRWADVDLDAGSVAVSGTIVMSDEKPSRPFRQPFPKGKKPRVLLLPQFAVDMLLRRRVNLPAENVHDAVFPSTNGTWRNPGNLRKQLDRILGQIGLEWVTPHSFRKTVATVIANEGELRDAAGQLGNGEDVTRRHYVQRAATGPDARSTLERFAPGSSNE